MRLFQISTNFYLVVKLLIISVKIILGDYTGGLLTFYFPSTAIHPSTHPSSVHTTAVFRRAFGLGRHPRGIDRPISLFSIDIT